MVLKIYLDRCEHIQNPDGGVLPLRRDNFSRFKIQDPTSFA